MVNRTRGKPGRKHKTYGNSKATKDGVRALVIALKEHKKFKQMCIFSLDTLVKAVCPPNTSWEDNVDLLVENDGINSLTDLLERYAGDEEILVRITTILAQIPRHRVRGKKFTQMLVEGNAVRDTLNSMKKNPHIHTGIDNAMSLLESCAKVNPGALGNEDHIAAILSVNEAFKDRPQVVTPIARTLEKIGRNAKASANLVSGGAIKSVLTSFSFEGASEESVLPGLRMLNRMCISKANIGKIEAANGIKILVGVLDDYQENEAILTVGGRLINKVAGEFLDKVLRDLKDPTLPIAELEYTVSLVSNLAIRQKNAKKIVEYDGIPTLVKMLTDPKSTKKMMAAAARTLGRIAISDDAIGKIVAQGGIEALVACLNAHVGDKKIASACANALRQLANKSSLPKLASAGAHAAIIRAVLAHPEFKELAVHGMEYLADVINLGESVNTVVKLKAIEACMKSLAAQKGVAKVAAAALSALNAMAMTSEANAQAIAGAGGVAAACTNLSEFVDNADIVLPALELLSTLADTSANVPAIVAGGAIDACIDALYLHSENDDIQKAGMHVMRKIVSESAIQAALKQLVDNLDPLIDTRNKKAAGKVEHALMALSIFAGCNAPLIVKENTVAIVLDALRRVDKAKRLPRKGAIINGTFRVVRNLFNNRQGCEDELLSELEKPGCVETVVAYIKGHPKARKNLAEGVQVLEALAAVPGAVDLLIDRGVIEALVAALKSNDGHLMICTHSVNALGSVANSDKGAVAVAQHGGTARLLASLNKICGLDEFQQPATKMLNVLYNVARQPVGKSTLNKQNAVDQVVSALTKRSNDETFRKAGLRVLAQLLDKAQVKQAVKELVAGSKAVSVQTLPDLSVQLATVGFIALVGDFGQMVVDLKGVDALVKAMKGISALPDSPEKMEALESAINTLGLLSKKVPPEAYTEVVPIVLDMFDATRSLACLRCLERLACVEGNIDAICAGDTIETLLEILRNEGDDPIKAASVLDTLATLAQNSKARAKIISLGGNNDGTQWMQYNMEEPDEEAMSACLKFLAGLCLDPAVQKGILADPAILESVADMLAEKGASDGIVGAGLDLFANLGASDGTPEKFMQNGYVARLVPVISSGANMTGSETPGAWCKFVKTMADRKALRDDLIAMHTVEELQKAMGANPNNEDVMNYGPQALSKLLSAKELIKRSMAKINATTGEIKAGSTGKAKLKDLALEMKTCANLMYIDGAVDAGVAKSLLSMCNNTVPVMAIPALRDNDQAVEVCATALQMLGKLASLGMELNMADAIGMLDAIAAAGVDKLPRQETLAVLSALDMLCDNANAAALLLEHGWLDKLGSILDASRSAGDDELHEAAEKTFSKLAGMQLGNLAGMMETPQGVASAVRLVSRLGNLDEGGLLGALKNIQLNVAGGDAILAGLMSANLKSMPEGWTAQIDPASGKTYYVKPDGSSVWELPDGCFDAKTVEMSLHVQAAIASMLDDAIENDPASVSDMQVESMCQALIDLDFDAKLSGDIQGTMDKLMAAFAALADTPEGAARIAKTQALIDKLADRLPKKSTAVATQAAAILKGMAKDAKPKTKDALMAAGVVEKAVKGLTAHNDDAGKQKFLREDLALLRNMLGTLGSAQKLADAGVTQEAFGKIDGAVSTFKKDAKIQEPGQALIDALHEVYADESNSDKIARSLEEMAGVCENAAHVQSVKDAASGKIYYVNTKTNATSWEPPEELQDMHDHFNAQAAAIKDFEGKVGKVKPEVIEAAVKAMTARVCDYKVVEKIAETLVHLADDPDNVQMLADYGAIEAAIAALKEHPDNEDLLKTLLVLLDKFTANDVFKNRIGFAGGIEVVIKAIRAQCAPEKVMAGESLPLGWIECKDKEGRVYYYNANTKKTTWDKPQKEKKGGSVWQECADATGRKYYYNTVTKKTSWTVPEEEVAAEEEAEEEAELSEHHKLVVTLEMLLSKLTFNSKQNTDLAVKFEGIDVMQLVMTVFPKSPPILEIDFNCLSNWCVISDDYKRRVLKRCGRQILQAIQTLSKDTAMFKMALRCIGNLSLVDENVLWFVENRAVEYIVSWMKQPDKEEEALETAIKVIGNFAKSSEDLADGVDKDHTVAAIIFREGGAHAILNVARTMQDNTSLLLASMDALNDIASETATAEKLLPAGLTQLVVKTMQMYDYDEEIIEPTVEVVATLSYSEKAVDEFVSMDGLQVLFAAMETHDTVEDLLINAQITANVVSRYKRHRAAVHNEGGIDTILKLMSDHVNESEFMAEALGTLGRLAAETELCQYIAEEGMPTIMMTIKSSFDDAEMLDYAFKLVGFLSFEKQNVQLIVQQDGVKVIMEAIGKHSHSEKLMTRCIKTLDFIAMAHPEFAAIVVAHGGVQVIRKIMGVYRGTQDIQESGNSALLFLEDVNLDDSAPPDFDDDLGPPPPPDDLDDLGPPPGPPPM